MNDFKKPFKSVFKKNKEKNKSPMFTSPSHYWTASQTDFLHSKGSANVELSIDPFNKSLIRIFCQSIDAMVNYKSIEYCAKTTVQQVIEKMIKVLRLNKQMTELLLFEAVGRCMALNKDGSTENKLAKNGQPCVFIEQNRRMLISSDYILTVLNYWKPMIGFSRRFEICEATKSNQMSSCDAMEDSGIDNSHMAYPMYFDRNGSISSISQKSLTESEDRSTQTDTFTSPPVAPRRKMSTKIPQCPHLLILNGENDINQGLMIPLNDLIQFGGPGSDVEVCLKRLIKHEKKIICEISKERNVQQSNDQFAYEIYLERTYMDPNLLVSVNGVSVTERITLNRGDIINIGDFYTFYFKDGSSSSNQKIKIINYINSTQDHELSMKQQSNGVNSDRSEHAVTSSSISSCSDVNSTNKSTMQRLKSRKKVSIDLNGITLACFDTALNQVIIHYFKGRMDLQYAVGFALYLIRFCRESSRCSFTIEDMHDRMTKRFCKTLENAYNEDSYLTGTLKLTALGFQTWLVYHNENIIEATEENRQWLNFLESFTSESFDHLCDYICENTRNMSLCFFEENPFVKIDQSQQYEEEDVFTIEKLLIFLSDIFDKISQICCSKTVEIFKQVIISRLVIYLTETTVTVLLSEMGTFTWNKGIQISTQIEKLEDWLKTEGQHQIYTADGFLHDFSKLISTRSEVLKEMDWKSLRQNYRRIPPSILRQFLSPLAADDNRVLLKWKPSQAEMFESSQDVGVILSEYLKTAETCSIFQPGIILQIDCIPIDKVIQSVEFISLCTVFDTELIGMAENFQWMALPRPPSFANFKNSRWMALQKSIGENRTEDFLPATLIKRNIYSSEKKPPRRKLQTDSDYSSSSYKGETITPSKKLIARYLLHKSNLNAHSKSLVSLNEQEAKPKPPRRKKYKGSVISLTNTEPMLYDNHSSSQRLKSRSSICGKSCSTNIGRSTSFGSDASPAAGVDFVDHDHSSINDVSDIERTIEEMGRELRITDPDNKLDRLNLNSSLSPSFENGYYDEDDEDQMSVGLSASGMINRFRAHSKSSDALVNIDETTKVEVVLNKSSDESYGITIADGMQTDLHKEGIFIYKISKNSPAYRSGKIKPGDQILSINNYSVAQLNFNECLMLMTKALTSLKLLIEKADLQRTIRIMSIYQ